jgi:hypothetical protein
LVLLAQVLIGFGGTTNGYNRVFGNNSTSDGLFLASATGRGIYFRANGGSTDHMAIISSGNVGIGTDNPSAKFYVNNSGGTGNPFYVNTGNSGNTTLFEHTGASTPVPFTLKKSGFSGASPYYGLLYLYMNDSTVNNGSNLYFVLNDSAGNSHEYAGLGGTIRTNTNGAEAGDLFFMTSDAGTARSEKMRIISNGCVGIGTSNPSAKLDIAGSTEARYLEVNAIAGFAGLSSGSAAMVEFRNAGDGNTLFIKTQNSSRTDAAPLAVWTENNPRFLVRNDGNVGVGLSNPSAKLEVNGNIKASLSNVNQANFVAYNSSTGLFTYASTGSIIISTATNADNVYINEDATDADQPVLFAENNEEYYPVRSNKSQFFYNPSTGTLTVPSLIESSALRFKENIVHLTGSLQDIEKLQGVSYNRIGQTRKEIGFIADEVVKILPELVKYQDGEVYGLSYNRVTAVLVEAVKELSDKVNQQEIFIQDLADRLKKLEDKG